MAKFPETAKAAEKWLRDYYRLQNIDRTKPCEHGHFDCSTVDGGICMDEVLSAYPELAE